uniref:Paired box protein Pax-6-like n=1 Tax=Saccoglossus kowalevskii TaxID=10224 RepID=A0ABM0M6S9_SACKO|nr:PREDICTED: paired box protein Pax-6-like [Saccoglossus kowalevskii]
MKPEVNMTPCGIRKTFSDSSIVEIDSGKLVSGLARKRNRSFIELHASRSYPLRRRNTGRRVRTYYTKYQEDSLESMFAMNCYPDVIARECIAYSIDLPEDRVQNWFRNRRVKRMPKTCKLTTSMEQSRDDNHSPHKSITQRYTDVDYVIHQPPDQDSPDYDSDLPSLPSDVETRHFPHVNLRSCISPSVDFDIYNSLFAYPVYPPSPSVSYPMSSLLESSPTDGSDTSL